MIKIDSLSFQYKHKIILEDIDLFVERGSFSAIVGPNGAGKSTLIKILLGQIRDYRGQIQIEGQKHHEWLKRNPVGYLPQNEQARMDFPLTVTELVLMGLAGQKGILRNFSKNDRKLAHEILESVGLLTKKDDLISTLSGGEFQRVLLARAMITWSGLLILDEPEASLDRVWAKSFFTILRDLNKKGVTIIVVSHDLNVITKFCNKIICLNKNLHCHDEIELLTSDVIRKTYGDVIQLIEKDY